MYKKIVDIILTILLIANFAIAIWYCFDPSFFKYKLEDDTRTTIALSMVGSWAIIGGLAFSAEMSR
jgi:hypothetical protein